MTPHMIIISHTIVWTLLLGLLCLAGYQATRITRKGRCSTHRSGAHDYSISFLPGFYIAEGKTRIATPRASLILMEKISAGDHV